jgi:hypothetical protein
LGDCEDQIFVEEVLDHFGLAKVVPATVDEQEAVEKLEFAHGKVTGLNSLHPLLTIDPNSDMCLHNHRDIISAITHGKCNSPKAILHGLYDIPLLPRSHTAANHGLAVLTKLNKQFPTCLNELQILLVAQLRVLLPFFMIVWVEQNVL